MSAVRVWSLPVTKDKALRLWDLLERKLEPSEAIDHLYFLFGHEEMFAEFEEAQPGTDVRPYILRYLKDMLRNPPPCYRKAWQDDAWKICEAAVYQRRIGALA